VGFFYFFYAIADRIPSGSGQTAIASARGLFYR
jgi:hypothetical protein